MSLSKIPRLLFFCLFVSKFFCQASELSLREPMGLDNAPLGTVWVQDLEQSIKQYHLKMAKIELDATSAVGTGVQTNIALFGLNIRMKNGDVTQILDHTSKIFLSGGHMLVDPKNGNTEDIASKRKRCRDDLTAQEEKLKTSRQDMTKFIGRVLEDTENTQKLSEDFSQNLRLLQKSIQAVKHAKDSVKKLQAEEETYVPSIFTKDPSRYKKDYLNALYDPEQTITRIIDHHVKDANVNEINITINEQTFETKNIDCIVLNLHSRTDMCPFCSMFLAHKLQEWMKKLISLPFIAVVTSRQEYRCDFEFIRDKIYYRGYSMRSFGLRMNDDGLSFDGLKAIVSEGLVVQYALQQREIYLLD